MREEISIANILAYCMKKWRSVLVGMLAGCVLLGAFQGYKQLKVVKGFNPEAAKIEYERAYEQYIWDLDAIDQKIARTEKSIEATNIYLDESYYMILDANNLWVSEIDLVINVVNDDDYQVTVEYNTTPESYLVSKIQSVYLSKWNTVDAQQLGDGGVFEYSDKYIREVVTVNSYAGGILRVQAYADTEENSQYLVNSVADYLIEQAKSVSQVTNEHSITILSKATNIRVDDSVFNTQTSKSNSLEQKIDALADLKADKDALPVPVEKGAQGLKECAKQILKYALVGIVLGFIAVCGVAALGFVLADKVVSQKEIVEYAGEKYLGSVQSHMSGMDRMAVRLMGDRLWDSEGTALQYVVENIKKNAAVKRITLVSTMPQKQVTTQIEVLANALKDHEFEVETLTDAMLSVKMLASADNAGEVVMVEKSGSSKLNNVVELKKMCEAQQRKILGFVMIQ